MGFFEAGLAFDQEREREEKKRKELEALAAIRAAQGEIKQRDDAAALLDTLGTLDFSQMRDASNPEAVPVDTGVQKFDFQKPEGGQIGGRGILFPEQKRRLASEAADVPQPAGQSSEVNLDSRASLERLEKLKNEDIVNRNVAPFASTEIGSNYLKQMEPKLTGSSGGRNGWEARAVEWDRIAAMPAGTERNAAELDYFKKWSPSTGYAASPEYIDQSVKRAVATETATIPAKAQGAAASTSATGAAKAQTPEFIADEKKNWEQQYKDWTETSKNYEFAINAKNADSAVRDVALIKALEKIREPQSAVMYGDYQTWQKANTTYGKLLNSGAWDAFNSKLSGKLDDDTRNELYALLDKSFNVAQQGFNAKRENFINTAIGNYGWSRPQAENVYRGPTAFDRGGGQQKNPPTASAIPSGPTQPTPTGTSATDQLKALARSGDKKARAYLTSKGETW